MADSLREAFDAAIKTERADAFHIAFKAGFRAAEFRDHEHISMKGNAPPATDAEIVREGERALHRAPLA